MGYHRIRFAAVVAAMLDVTFVTKLRRQADGTDLPDLSGYR
jgi:hypothetical protein